MEETSTAQVILEPDMTTAAEIIEVTTATAVPIVEEPQPVVTEEIIMTQETTLPPTMTTGKPEEVVTEKDLDEVISTTLMIDDSLSVSTESSKLPEDITVPVEEATT